jgi:hypothetical protein
MAWRPPMAPKSIPYWNGDIETRVQARIHFQFSRRPLVMADMLTDHRFTAYVMSVDVDREQSRLFSIERIRRLEDTRRSASTRQDMCCTSCKTWPRVPFIQMHVQLDNKDILHISISTESATKSLSCATPEILASKVWGCGGAA